MATKSLGDDMDLNQLTIKTLLQTQANIINELRDREIAQNL